MTQKTVYVKISDRLECIEFNINTSTDDLKGRLLEKKNKQTLLEIISQKSLLNFVHFERDIPLCGRSKPKRHSKII